MSKSCICLADCIGNACASFIYGVGQIDGCKCQLIFCHDVCHSHLLQFAGAKQAVLRVPTLMSVRCPCRASLAGAYHISVPLESSMQAAHFAAKLNVFARMHSNSLGCLVGKLYQAYYYSFCSGHSGHWPLQIWPFDGKCMLPIGSS